MSLTAVYALGFVSMYLNGLLAFHLIDFLRDNTAHPVIYSLFLFPSSGLVIFFGFMMGFSRLCGMKLSGDAGLFGVFAYPITLISAASAASSGGMAAYGLPMLVSAIVFLLFFAITFIGIGAALRWISDG
ncbi:hypothetical protein JMM61_20310 [Rhodovulum sulfidophilum]|uniref:hypothetical protein n=1 Tax=Rhodovulum sulfidophilum TaxID=35806 RepID=UPI001926D848|nr:hypothetical protein [Rhodovulum sulfidophilum]MBL3587659.1 hypothetical protein [Rhodovulum sulfidophilum]